MDSSLVRVTELAKHVWLVELVGDHDLSTQPRVEAAIEHVFRSGSNLVLDLSAATFIDSTVLAAILEAQARADQHEQDELAVVAPEGSPARRLLDLVMAANRIQVYDSRSAAIEGLHYR